MSEPALGVIRQMASEQRAADALAIPWRTRFFIPSGTSSPICVDAGMSADNRIQFRRAYYSWLKREIENCDVVMLRHLQYDPFQYAFIRSCRKPVYLVHHSLEGAEILGSGGVKSWVQWMAESVNAWLSIRRAAGIVAVTDEIARYEKLRSGRSTLTTFIYPNGIDYSDNIVVRDVSASDAMINMLFVSSVFRSWQGLDLLLDALNKSAKLCKVHIVGQLEPAQERRVRSDPRCVIHGTLDIAQLTDLMQQCHIGLGAFALDRNKFTEACTLKVREYLRAGLPVYSGHKDVLPETFPYYKCGPCDLDMILAYAESMLSTSGHQVSSASQAYIDKQKLLGRLYEQLQADFHESICHKV